MAINNKLKNNNLVDVRSIVNNDLSVVLLGKVNNIRDKMLAEHITQQKFKEFKGIRNEILVEESTNMPVQSEPYVINISKLEDNINNELRDKGLKNISAKVNNDLSVVLFGKVNDHRDKILAENIVGGFDETKEVKNEIQVETPVKKTATKPTKIDPSKHENDINRALRNGGVYDITAEVNKNLDIILRGSTTQHEKDKAISIVKKFKNKKIIDMIFVKIYEEPISFKKY
ncbi:MAG TPA: BON domain-containing protein [Candidatus Hydrogenedens sp.]|nr:BON domain-containing protein [Candidatus Hydrogenedens sp.]